jgi:DNA-binding NtrC family response regulator
VPIRISPLRERPGDLLTILTHYFKKLWPYETIPQSLAFRFVWEIMIHKWPGNVRELIQEVGYYIRNHKENLTSEGEIEDESLDPTIVGSTSLRLSFDNSWQGFGLQAAPQFWLRFGKVPIADIERFAKELPCHQGGRFNKKMIRFMAEYALQCEQEMCEEDRRGGYRAEESSMVDAWWNARGKLQEYLDCVGRIRRQGMDQDGQVGIAITAFRLTKDPLWTAQHGEFLASLDEGFQAVAHRFVVSVYNHCGRNFVKAARSLGLHRETVMRMVNEYRQMTKTRG